MYQAVLLYSLARLIVSSTSLPALFLWLLSSSLTFLAYDFSAASPITDPEWQLDAAIAWHAPGSSFANMTCS